MNPGHPTKLLNLKQPLENILPNMAKPVCYKIRRDLMSENISTISTKITGKGNKKILICNIYREFKIWGPNNNDTENMYNQSLRLRHYGTNMK